MLFAVEGGGFFSASASGYSKGLTLLLLGQRDDDKPMRVSPWNHYQLVNQETDTDIQLASEKSRLSRGCAPFGCFGRASAGLDVPSPLKVGPTQHLEVVPELLSGDQIKSHKTAVEDISHNGRKVGIKSSLKKPSAGNPVPELDNAGTAACLDMSEDGGDELGLAEGRRVQWPDGCGHELVEIREFEPSEAGGSDDGLDHVNVRSCSCTIM
ncbi:hypothetical protein MLD38_013078 [Melastoma candidum]|uniref:Uncharacterized protein n=1 Tax=Melastoma candidum TaxID=119954 RepID=A0ACB9R8F1_9MYRT|nr:hypothetical protein MLD38_013078 [Melastoma candidum]